MGQTCKKCSNPHSEQKREVIIYPNSIPDTREYPNGHRSPSDFHDETKSFGKPQTDPDAARYQIMEDKNRPNGNDEYLYPLHSQSQRHMGSDIKFTLTDHKDAITLADGSTFEGNTINGLPEGYGKQIMPNGDEYLGYFIKGKRNGVGKLYRRDGFTYHGDFENNRITGFGVMRLPEGDEYRGEFKHGVYHGKGRFVDVNGRVTEGIWVDGKFQKNL